MSVETKSLEMHRQFYGEQSLITGIEGMMQFASLNNFVDEAKRMINESHPFFSQAYLLFIYYKQQILNFNLEAQNNIAAKKLLEAFGPASTWVDPKTGETNRKKTEQIIEIHDDLVTDVETTSTELPVSARALASLIATMQRKIVDLLIRSQEADLLKLEQREKEEKRLSKHLAKKAQTKEITIKESVQVSVRSQEKRIKQSNEEENTLSRQLGTLIRFSKKIFAPAKQELRAMPMTA
jgi:hypothetical protein